MPGANSRVETREGDRYAEREERDPSGGELPLTDPNPGWNYVSTKGDSPLYIQGGDPFDYSGGCTRDGMPWNCADAARSAQSGATYVDYVSPFITGGGGFTTVLVETWDDWTTPGETRRRAMSQV